jgi:hypothetical protein
VNLDGTPDMIGSFIDVTLTSTTGATFNAELAVLEQVA